MRYVPLLAILLTAACESSTGPDITTGVRLTASGLGIPALATQGDPQTGGGGVMFASFAAAQDTAGMLAIWGLEQNGATGDLFVLQTLGNHAGTYTGCGQDVAPECHGRYIVGVSSGNMAAHDAWYEIVGGEVEVTSVEGGRVAGRFDVILQPQGGGASVAATGEFNVPVLAPAAAGAVNCFAHQITGGFC